VLPVFYNGTPFDLIAIARYKAIPWISNEREYKIVRVSADLMLVEPDVSPEEIIPVFRIHRTGLVTGA